MDIFTIMFSVFLIYIEIGLLISIIVNFTDIYIKTVESLPRAFWARLFASVCVAVLWFPSLIKIGIDLHRGIE